MERMKKRRNGPSRADRQILDVVGYSRAVQQRIDREETVDQNDGLGFFHSYPHIWGLDPVGCTEVSREYTE